MMRCKSLKTELLVLPLFLIIISCKFSLSGEDESFVLTKQAEKEWNYLIYMGADNNLERYAVKNITALQKVGTNSNTNILVLFDRSPGYDKSNDNWSGTKLLWITKNPSNLNADIVKDFGELDMTDSKNLYNFLEFANDYFPAKHVVLDIWGHGRGVYPDAIIQNSRGVIEDYTTGYGADRTMTIYNFAKAIKDYEDKYNKTIDIIQFDTCLMQSIEISWQLKNLANYIVGTETEAPANGSDYESIANYFYNNATIDTESLAKFLTISFYEYEKNSPTPFSICTVKTSEFENLKVDFNKMCNDVMEYLEAKSTDILEERTALTQIDTGYTEYADLNETVSSFSKLGIDCSSLLEKLSNLIIESKYNKNSLSKSKGISINYPYTAEHEEYYIKDCSDYKILDFYLDTNWGCVLKKILCKRGGKNKSVLINS